MTPEFWQPLTHLLAKNKILKDSVRGVLSLQFWRILLTASQENSFFCCLVARLGWRKQSLQILSPHTWHTGNAVIPRKRECTKNPSGVVLAETQPQWNFGIAVLPLWTAGLQGCSRMGTSQLPLWLSHSVYNAQPFKLSHWGHLKWCHLITTKDVAGYEKLTRIFTKGHF